MSPMKKHAKEPCDFCPGTLHPKRVRVIRSRGRKLVIIDDVPATVCSRCGMRYYDATVVRGMEAILKRSPTHTRTIRVPVTKFVVVA